MSNTAFVDLRKRIGETVALFSSDYASRMPNNRVDEKLFRDPIFGFQKVRAYEVLIIDSPLFQRLRSIMQTSVAHLTYPSSIHTRFEHSINCLHLAEIVLKALHDNGVRIDPTHWAEVRLAALLHDIGHCIYSHGSEFFYRELPELTNAMDADEILGSRRNAGELINYCIITSDQFKEMIWEPTVRCYNNSPNSPKYDFDIDGISLTSVAQMIIGMNADGKPHRRFQTEIVNGPMDVDKLDYMHRDGYFTGVNQAIDIDRLLPSLRVEKVRNSDTKREEKRLVVDYRGIAVVEQLLFARMVLYDTVYHHHKVRATNALLQSIFRKGNLEDWPTRSGKLTSICDLLELDERDFLAKPHTNADLASAIKQLRTRAVPERALVIAPRTIVDKDGHTKWSTRYTDFISVEDDFAKQKATEYFASLRKKACDYAQKAGAQISPDDVMIDIPDPPGFGRLGQETLIQLTPGVVVPLREFFPFDKVINRYSREYKYRAYVFSPERWKAHVAYGAFRAFSDIGIVLNDLSLILAHQNEGTAHDLLVRNRVPIPDWRDHFYMPDEEEMKAGHPLAKPAGGEIMSKRSTPKTRHYRHKAVMGNPHPKINKTRKR